MQLQDKQLQILREKIDNGIRLDKNEGIALMNSASLLDLGALADICRCKKHPEPIVTFVIGRIINYTNVCWVRCNFCAFSCDKSNSSAYILSSDEILSKINELSNLGGTEVLFQGGLNSDLKLDWFVDIFKTIKTQFPNINIHGLSPAEIKYLSVREQISIMDTISTLKHAGLSSVPGGGAEILSDRVRSEISPRKISVKDWLDIMKIIHQSEMKSTATMMFGHIETPDERVEHLIKIRELQDETNGFTSFTAWPFQPEDTPMARIEKSSTYDYLRMLAVSRLMLDNIPNIQLSILTQGPKVSQIALQFGANDLGSIMIEENVVSGSGNKYIPTIKDAKHLITSAGYTPKRRNTQYEILK